MNQILQKYKDAFDKVKSEVSELFDTTYPTLEKKKLDKVERIIAVILAELQNFTINFLTGSLKDIVKAEYTRQAEALGLSGLKISDNDLNLVLSDKLWVDDIRAVNGNLLTNIKRDIENLLRLNMRDAVVSGNIPGGSFADLMDLMKKNFDRAINRLNLVVGYYTKKYQSQSLLYLIEKAKLKGIKVQKYWKHNPEPHPRPHHLAANGRAADENGIFHIGGKMTEAPGLFGDPTEDLNCRCNLLIEVI